MKEELEDIFGSIELDHNVDIYINDYSTFFKIQIIAWEQNVDIEKLYDSSMECVDRSKSIDGITPLANEIAWSYKSYTHPECYTLRSKEDIEKTRRATQVLYDTEIYYRKKAKFFGFIIYLNKKFTEVKKWKEFNLLKESKDPWDNILEIVNDLRDDIESEYEIGFSQIHKNKMSVYGDTPTNIKLTIIPAGSVNIIDFNNYIISRLEWISEKEEAYIDEVYLLLNNPSNLPKKLKPFIGDTGMKLTNKNGDLIDNLKLISKNIVSWGIYFYP